MAYSTISKPSLHFNTKLFTGNGGTQSITGVGFQPDFTWIKERSETRGHNLTDAVRGAPKYINSATTDAEVTSVSTTLTSFDSDGFSLGSYDDVNKNSQTYVGWNWKANGAGSANTDGATNSTVSVNTTAGFSIVSWTGTGSATTIGHGLGVAPELIMLKNRTGVYGWQTYWKVLGSNKYLALDGTDGERTSTQSWNNTAPTSSVFSVDGDSNNKNTQNIIAYCFKEKKGYSKFGSYTGNANADGTFIYLGFKPAFIIYKRYDGDGYSWVLVDNKRNTFNAVDKYVHPDLSAAEGTVTLMDFLSNGFKMRVNDTTSNTGSIVYMAFAEEPLVANVGASIPATAR